jgi:hypothetical protein
VIARQSVRGRVARWLAGPLVGVRLAAIGAFATVAGVQPAPAAAPAAAHTAAPAAAPTAAHTAAPAAAPARDSLVISVLTFEPGEELFERFGHIAIRVHNVSTGSDVAYNWGMFDFNQPHFYRNFLTGDTKYWMEGFPALPFVDLYRRQGRTIWEQDLALTRTEADSLRTFIEWNAREENKYYRYDYYRDDCATRVRDAIDAVLGGAFKQSVAGLSDGVTYRSETLRLGAAYPLTNFGMDYVLGRPADRVISSWEEMFIPMRVRDILEYATIRRNDGTVAKLVGAQRQLATDRRFAERMTAPDYSMPASIAGATFTVVAILLALLATNYAAARVAFITLATTWHALAGVLGVILACAGAFTKHVYMSGNVNVLLATPVSLALAVLIPLAFRRIPRRRLVRASVRLSLLAAAIAIVTVALHLVPALWQQNGAILAFAVPAHCAIAFGLAWIAAPGSRTSRSAV